MKLEELRCVAKNGIEPKPKSLRSDIRELMKKVISNEAKIIPIDRDRGTWWIGP